MQARIAIWYLIYFNNSETSSSLINSEEISGENWTCFSEPLRKEFLMPIEIVVQQSWYLCINCWSWLTWCAAVVFPYIPAIYIYYILVTAVRKICFPLHRLMSTMILITFMLNNKCNNCLMNEMSVSILLKLLYSLVISKASYINGDYCVPTYFMRIYFLQSLICMGWVYTNCCLLMKIRGPYTCQQEWVLWTFKTNSP